MERQITVKIIKTKKAQATESFAYPANWLRLGSIKALWFEI